MGSTVKALPIEKPQAVNSLAPITPEARQYALRQLAVRAGVSPDFFRSWRVEINDKATTVYVQPGTRRRIQFSNALPSLWEDLKKGPWRTVRAGWMQGSSAGQEPRIPQLPDFIIPFASKTHPEKQPLFRLTGVDCLECDLDLLASAVLTLSRFEETVAADQDEHG